MNTFEIALATLRQLALLIALLTPIELLWPARAQRLWRRGMATDLAHFVAAPFVVGGGAALLLAGIAALLHFAIPSRVEALLAAQPWTLQLVEILVIAELGGYWVHRLSHEVPWLWRFHAVHHSTREMDWMAAHRQHPLEAIALLGVANVPVLALGFATAPLLAFILAQKLYTAFLHANVRVGYGRLSTVIASPQFHHWHHDGDPTARARNFASLFPWIDRLFGSYEMPRGFPSSYGCDAPVPESWLGQLAFPLVPARRVYDARPCAHASSPPLSTSLSSPGAATR